MKQNQNGIRSEASTAVIGESGASPTKSAQDKNEFGNAMGMEIPDR